MQTNKIAQHITQWLLDYAQQAGAKGFIIGISGGIDSAVTSTLCAQTGMETFVLSMPIRQGKGEHNRALNHIQDLKKKYANVRSLEIDLTSSFESLEASFPQDTTNHFLSMANTRSRLRMLTLYAVGQSNGLLVAGTGNKVEDFGVGFYTKYGDGGVDLSPIADLMKTQVWQLAKEIGVLPEIIEAKPTDGLFDDGRSDEDQIGASYPELEWAMEFEGDSSSLSERQKEVLSIYQRFHRANKHKMVPIPVCSIPKEFFH